MVIENYNLLKMLESKIPLIVQTGATVVFQGTNQKTDEKDQ